MFMGKEKELGRLLDANWNFFKNKMKKEFDNLFLVEKFICTIQLIQVFVMNRSTGHKTISILLELWTLNREKLNNLEKFKFFSP